jgi:hypothetical protein
MKKGQKDTGDKNKKKGWGARLMSLIAGSSDEELAPSDDEQDEIPRGKGGKGGNASVPAAVTRVQEHVPIDSRAALKKMLKDPEQKKVNLRLGWMFGIAPSLFFQEVYEFADYLGMDVNEDQDFLWIAVEAMFAPLPRNWQEFENESGQIYYYNHRLVLICPSTFVLVTFCFPAPKSANGSTL